MTIKNLPEALIDAAKRVIDPGQKAAAIAAIDKNVQQGAISPEVATELKKTWGEDVDAKKKTMLDLIAQPLNEAKKKSSKIMTHSVGGSQAISVDARHIKSINGQAEHVHKTANKHFFGDESGVIADHDKHGSGHFLGTNMVQKYHVASVQPGMWVAALKGLDPTNTRKMVKKHLGLKEDVNTGFTDEQWIFEAKKKEEIHPFGVHTQFQPRGRYNKHDEHRRKAYKVVAVGPKVRGIKVGEHLSDTDLDDMGDMGFKHKAIKEDAEQVNELSKKTLGSYVNKASTSLWRQGMERGKREGEHEVVQAALGWVSDRGARSKAQDTLHDARFKADHATRRTELKRVKGINRAVTSLTKEGLDEMGPVKIRGRVRHKVGDLVDCSKELTMEDKDHVGKVVKVMGGEVRVQLPTGEGRAHQITVFHHEVTPHKGATALTGAYSKTGKPGGPLKEARTGDFKVGKTFKNLKQGKPNLGGCKWFMNCKNPATGTTPHPVLGKVPTCDRCNKFATEESSSLGNSAIVEAGNRELGHLLRKKVKDMSAGEMRRAANLASGRSTQKVHPDVVAFGKAMDKAVKKAYAPVVKEEIEADQNIMVHLRKSIDTEGKHETLFANGEKHAIPANVAKKVLERTLRLKPEARAGVQEYMQDSYENVQEVFGYIKS